MKTLSLTIDKTLRLLVASLFGSVLGMILWMITLPAGLISKRGVVIAVAAAVFFTFLYFKFLIPFYMRHYQGFKLNWLVIGAVLALLSGIAYQKVIVQQPLIFPFTPRQTLQIISQSENLSFRPIECELVTLYSGDFVVEGDLERESSSLMTLHGKGSSITWRGWPGGTCTFTLVKPDMQSAVEVSWNGQQYKVEDLPVGLDEHSLNIGFEVPFTTRLIISGILLLAISAVMMMFTCGFMVISLQNEQPDVIGQRTAGKWQFRLLVGLLAGLNLILFLRLLVSTNPYTHFPGRDQGVFLYIGEGLIKGQTPYLDTWDHKGPLIYFINALGKLLDPAGEWGVYSLMIVFLATAVAVMYLLLRERAGSIPLFGGLAVFLGLMLKMGAFDNLVELYALPFYALGLLAVINAVEKRNSKYMLLFGAAAALAFSLRPNLVSVFAVGGIYWLVEEIKRRGKTGRGLLFAFAGALLVLLPTVIFFGLRGALPDLFDQMFRFNFLYASVSEKRIWEKLTEIAPASLPVVIGGLICIFFTKGFYWKRTKDRHGKALTIYSLIFGLEFLLSRLSGYDFPHYSLPLLLIGSFLLVYLLELITKAIPIGWKTKFSLAMKAIAGVFVLGALLYQIISWIKFPDPVRSEEVLQAEFRGTLTRRPTLLVWGAETQINYLLGKDSPTRYVYQYPLLNDQYCSAEKGKEFLEDVVRGLPVILDTSNGNPWVPSLDANKREQAGSESHLYGNLACLNDFFDLVQNSYSPVYTMPGHRWTIYLPNDTGMASLFDN